MRILIALYKLLIAAAISLGIYLMPGQEDSMMSANDSYRNEAIVIGKKVTKHFEIKIGRVDGQYYARKTNSYKFQPANDDREPDSGDSYSPFYIHRNFTLLRSVKQFEWLYRISSFKKLLLYPKHSFW